MINWLGEHVRYFNFALAVGVIALMVDSSIRRRDKVVRRTRRVWFWFCLWVLNYIYGTGSNISDHIRLNPPAYIQTIILIGLGFAMLWHPEGDDRLAPEDLSLSTRFVVWLNDKVLEHKRKQ